MAKDTKPTEKDWIQRWAQSASLFVEECLGVDGSDPNQLVISTQQRELLDLVTKLVWAKVARFKDLVLKDRGTPEQIAEDDHLSMLRGISVMAGQGTGKDTAATWIILWFLFCFDRALVPCTAPTEHQLQQVLWRNISIWIRFADAQAERKGQRKLSETITWRASKVYRKHYGPEDWYAIPITVAAKSTEEEQAETLAGLHAPFMMYVCDEASGLPSPVFNPIEGSMTEMCNFALLIFNPTKLRCYAVETHTGKKSEFWAQLRWNAEECDFIKPEEIEQKRREYGRDSNFYRIRVLGLPPKADPDTLIPWDLIDFAASDECELERFPDDARVMSIDVAGLGKDKTVILTGTVGPGGTIIDEPHEHHSLDTDEVVNWAWGYANEFEPDVILVDANGIGFGVASGLRRRANFNVISIMAQANSTDPQCHMKYDQLWWATRKVFEDRSIKIPKHTLLMSQLNTPKIDEPHQGKTKVESNKRVKSRGAGSLDYGNALTFFQELPPRFLASMRRGQVERTRAKPRRAASWRVA